MKKTIKALKFSVVLLLTVMSFIACDKDFNVIESDVLGKENSNFTTNNTISPIVAYNKKLDSLQINGLASNLLGVFNDPAYGKTTASIITQVTPTSYNPDFGDNPVIDSVVINIPYYSTVSGTDTDGNSTYTLDSLYGNPTEAFKLSIYQNNYFLRSFDPNSEVNSAQNYYSNANSTTNSIFTGTSTVNFDDYIAATIYENLSFTPSNAAIKTTTGEDSDATTTRSAPAFRVVLRDDEDLLYWTNTIINKGGESELSNANNFYNYFRGLYIKTESITDDGSLILMNIGSSTSNITIHYSKDSSVEGERSEAAYIMNFTGNRLNTFVNDYNLVSFPTTPNKDLGDEKLYLKGASGSMAIIDLFPNGLEDFKNDFLDADGNPTRLINEAHLVIYEDEGIATDGNANFHKYDRIYAYDIKNNEPTYDYQIDPTESNNTISSKIISLSQRDTILGRYKIRLTEHLNNILLKDSTNTKIGLVLSTNVNYTNNSQILESNDDVTAIPSAALLTPRGTILYGSNENVPENKRLMLKIFYTEPN